MWFRLSDNLLMKGTVKIKKSRKGLVWWRTEDSLSLVSQWSDCYQNKTVSQITLLF